MSQPKNLKLSFSISQKKWGEKENIMSKNKSPKAQPKPQTPTPAPAPAPAPAAPFWCTRRPKMVRVPSFGASFSHAIIVPSFLHYVGAVFGGFLYCCTVLVRVQESCQVRFAPKWCTCKNRANFLCTILVHSSSYYYITRGYT